MVSAVVHGNELCGAIVLDWLLRERLRPVRGVLSLAFMNVAAFQSFDPQDPTPSRYVDEDFTGSGPSRCSTVRATASSYAAHAKSARCSTRWTCCSTSTRCSTPRRR